MAQFNEVNNFVPNPPKRAVPRHDDTKVSWDIDKNAEIVWRDIGINRMATVDGTEYCIHGIHLSTPCNACEIYFYKAGQQLSQEELKKRDDLINENLSHLNYRYESGATSSHSSLRYDLIPKSFTDCVALRFTKGEEQHGERNYHKGLADRKFIIDRINHIQEHWNKLLHPNYRSADVEDSPTIQGVLSNIGAMAWGLSFLCEVMEHDEGSKILGEILVNGQIKFK